MNRDVRFYVCKMSELSYLRTITIALVVVDADVNWDNFKKFAVTRDD
jgi:hypothetical protein